MLTGNHTTLVRALATCALWGAIGSGPALAADPPDLTGVWGNYRPPRQTGPGPLGAPVPEVRAERRWSLIPDGLLLSYECNEPTWLDHLDRLRAERDLSR